MFDSIGLRTALNEITFRSLFLQAFERFVGHPALYVKSTRLPGHVERRLDVDQQIGGRRGVYFR
jgi:hypothetical protein